MDAKTKEEQYSVCMDTERLYGRSEFGLMSNHTWVHDPKRLLFVLSRYKFVAKMFAGMGDVLEVGCADGFGSRIVAQHVRSLEVSDFDPIFVEDATAHVSPQHPYKCRQYDALSSPPAVNRYDGVYALDVLEHIDPDQETVFLGNLASSLNPTGCLLVGIPSLNSQAYASEASRAGHVNCKSGSGLCASVERFFHRVFLFSMNDEVVHTGFHEMSNYFLALCCCKRDE